MTSNEAKGYLRNAKTQARSIPNILSYFRFLLIPVFIVLYVRGDGTWSFVTLAVSALTDILDGRIARKYDMVTNLGKVIDPIADKVTQAAMILCVGLRFPYMFILLAIHCIKELAMFWLGYRVLDKTGTVNSAKWYGKVCTALLYAVMMLHVIWPQIPVTLSTGLMILCGAMIISCFIMYAGSYHRFVEEYRAAHPDTEEQEA